MDQDRWQTLWVSVVEAFEGSSGILTAPTPQGSAPEPLAAPGFTPDALKLYEAHFHAVDIWAHGLISRRGRDVHLSQELVAAPGFGATEIWNDFSRPHVGAFHPLGAALPLEGTGIGLSAIHRPRDCRDFDEADRRDFAKLVPHFSRALRLRARLREQDLRGRIGEAALDSIAQPVIIADAEAAVIYANAAAEALERSNSRLRLGTRDRGIEAGSPPETRGLRDLIRQTALGGPGGSMLLSRARGRPPIAASISRLPLGLAPDGQTRGYALALLRDLGSVASPDPSTLRQLFGATPAEADLAGALLAGHAIREIAEQRGTGVSTLRSQVSSLLGKTGCRRQSDLTRLLAGLSPPRAT